MYDKSAPGSMQERKKRTTAGLPAGTIRAVNRSARATTILAALLLGTTWGAGAIEPPSGIPLATPHVELFPIGWSRDGKFAYALVDQPAFRGGYGFLCAIVDARTDDVLWSDYDHSDAFNWSGDAAPLELAWQRHVPTISAELAAFGVEPVAGGRLEPLPLERGSDEYTAIIHEWRVNPETSPYGNGLVGYTVSLQSSERGSKVIAQRAHIFATDVRIQGYIRSPFEDRVVLLVAESGNAYGGERFTDFTVIGASLDAGFQ